MTKRQQYMKEWRRKNKARVNESDRKYRLKHIEKYREKSRAYYRRNREARRAGIVKWQQKNRARVAEYSRRGTRAYVRKNREACRARTVKWKRENPAKVKRYYVAFVRRNPGYRTRWEHGNPTRVKAYAAKKSRELSDAYIASGFGVSVRVLPKALIEAKRAQLMLVRALRRKS